MKKISAIIFDLDGTLYNLRVPRAIMGTYFVLTWFRRPIRTIKDVYILFHYRRAQEWLRRNQNRNINTNSQTERVSAVTDIPLEDVMESVVRWTEKIPLLFISFCARRKLIQIIKRWHEVGIPMGVYSDYPAEEKLQRLGIQKDMSVVLCSSDSEVGTFKPNPRGFQIVAKKLGLAPDECVYLGDREDVDIRGAQDAGMHGLLVNKKNLLWLNEQMEKTPRGMVQ